MPVDAGGSPLEYAYIACRGKAADIRQRALDFASTSATAPVSASALLSLLRDLVTWRQDLQQASGVPGFGAYVATYKGDPVLDYMAELDALYAQIETVLDAIRALLPTGPGGAIAVEVIQPDWSSTFIAFQPAETQPVRDALAAVAATIVPVV